MANGTRRFKIAFMDHEVRYIEAECIESDENGNVVALAAGEIVAFYPLSRIHSVVDTAVEVDGR